MWSTTWLILELELIFDIYILPAFLPLQEELRTYTSDLVKESKTLSAADARNQQKKVLFEKLRAEIECVSICTLLRFVSVVVKSTPLHKSSYEYQCVCALCYLP